jgi:hypothetical protein
MLDAKEPIRHQRIEQINRDVLIPKRDQRQAGKDHPGKQHLRHLESAGHGHAEEVAADHIDAGEQHQTEQHQRREISEQRHNGSVEYLEWLPAGVQTSDPTLSGACSRTPSP